MAFIEWVFVMEIKFLNFFLMEIDKLSNLTLDMLSIGGLAWAENNRM